MNVIGYSGLDASAAFKRRMLPNLDVREYSIVQGQHAAAALVSENGVVAAAAEERFTRVKGTGRFPANAIRFCMERGGLSPKSVGCVAHAFSYEPYRDVFACRDEYSRRQFDEVFSRAAQDAALLQDLGEFGWGDRLVAVPHHLAHAASAYWLSGLSESLIFVCDGIGEVHSCTVAVGQGGRIQPLREYPADSSLGLFYGILTHYLGFTMDRDEYKVMGLSALGDPRVYFDAMAQFAHPLERGGLAVPLLREDRTAHERETHSGALRALAREFGPPRRPEEALTRHHANVAAACQAVLQTSLLGLLRHFRASTGLDAVCIAGGVGLNGAANGVLVRSRVFRSVFVQPAAGDDGAALGAALYGLYGADGVQPFPHRMGLPYWGPEYTAEQVRAAVRGCQEVWATEYPNPTALVADVAQMLASDSVVAWFQGRMEFGPRALGNRSILADPRPAAIRERLNKTIKHREDFRPFAPLVTAEDANRFFEILPGDERTYEAMLVVARVRPQWRSRLQAVTHVDGTARVQPLARDHNPLLWELLRAFEKLTGLPVLLNTSFNGPGEPIVCTPDHALATFRLTGLDALAIGPILVRPARSRLLEPTPASV